MSRISPSPSTPSSVIVVTEKEINDVDPPIENVNPLHHTNTHYTTLVVQNLSQENKHLKAEIEVLKRVIEFGISGRATLQTDELEASDPLQLAIEDVDDEVFNIEKETARKFEEIVHARAAILVDDLMIEAKRIQESKNKNKDTVVLRKRLCCVTITRWRVLVFICSILALCVFGGVIAALFLGKSENSDHYFS
jgi:hypothetical protein